MTIVNLSKENDMKRLEQLKTGFKRATKWNKYRSQITVQLQNNNINYLTDPTFTNANRLFILSLQRISAENNAIKDHRDIFSHYCVPNIDIKDFKVLINRKRFLDFPVKNKEEAYEKIMNMSNNNDCTTSNLLDFVYFLKEYKLIAIDLSKQTKLKDLQQISFIGKLLSTRRATIFSIIEKSEENTLDFSQNSFTII